MRFISIIKINLINMLQRVHTSKITGLLANHQIYKFRHNFTMQ